MKLYSLTIILTCPHWYSSKDSANTISYKTSEKNESGVLTNRYIDK